MSKYLIYVIAAAAAALVTGITLILMHFPTVIIISWAVAGAIILSLIAHVVVNTINKEMDPVKWQITIYGVGIAAGWITAILSSSWGLFSFGLALMAGCGMMMLGTFVLMKKSEHTEDKAEDDDALEDVPAYDEESVTETANRLINELRYEYVDDVIGGALNSDKPLCLVDGNPLTVAEAIEKGLDDVAEKGMAYIEKIMED